MKKTLLITILCAMFGSGAAYGQTQSLSFQNDTDGGAGNSGSYMPGQSFSFDIFLTFATYYSPGYSLWFEVPSTLAPFITITSNQYFTFTDPTDGPSAGNENNEPNGYPKAFTSSAGASSGFMTDTDTEGNPQDGMLPHQPGQGDLGATGIQPQGTYKILRITFTLSGSAPTGGSPWSLQTTTNSPKRSIVSDSSTNTGTVTDQPLGQTIYTLNLIPEPSTLALIGVTAVAGAVIARRRRTLRG
jgi:hypothetical protein